jgi:hypothetical protein
VKPGDGPPPVEGGVGQRWHTPREINPMGDLARPTANPTSGGPNDRAGAANTMGDPKHTRTDPHRRQPYGPDTAAL